MTGAKLYWLGNIAKTKVIDEILRQVGDQDTLIFDYGCGTGGDWPRILADCANLRMVGYEPNPKSYAAAVNRLRGLRAEVYTGDDLQNLTFEADFIVSFSVFEHVYDRRQYLQNARRLLAPDGVFYLNYDDGHFRLSLDLGAPRTWPVQMRVWLHNRFAAPLARLGMVGQFQQRVARRDVDRMVSEAGFRILRSFYSNLSSFKGLCKRIPEAQQADFSALWLATEDRLNAEFLSEGPAALGDTANLWQHMGSRTLVLCHA
ncbi:MAG: class I SAM-dependent methyltransferase [Anaerolineae bacterium]|nr:class I SAM-dependent methyltransferase [Anaerolineae bacterium]